MGDDPEPERLEQWLIAQCLAAPRAESVGAYRAMALDIVAEWRLAQPSPDFRHWIEWDVPSDDTSGEERPR